MPTPLLPLPPVGAAAPMRRTTSHAIALGALVGGLFGAAVAGLAVGSGMRVAKPFVHSAPGPALLVPMLGAAFLLAILVHELGHVVFGLAQRMRFMLLVVGPLKLERDGEDDHVHLRLNRNLEMAGGLAACVPQDARDMVPRLKWFVAGGPIASLVLALTCMTLAWTLPTAWYSAPLAFTGLISATLGLCTILPLPNGSFVTDGMRFLRLARGGALAARDAAQLTLTVQDRAGTPTAALDAHLVAQALAPVDGSMHEVMGRATAWSWLLPQPGREAEALLHLQRAQVIARGLPFDLEALITHELAFHTAFVDGDAASARAMLEPHAKALARMPAFSRARCEAAIALAAGDIPAALAQVAESRARLAALPGRRTGSMLWALDRLDEIEQRVRARIA